MRSCACRTVRRRTIDTLNQRVLLSPNLHMTDGQSPRDDLRECPDPAGADLEGMPCYTNHGDTTAAPRSLHPGGVIAINADASVHWIANEVDAVTFGSMICINDGLVSKQ